MYPSPASPPRLVILICLPLNGNGTRIEISWSSFFTPLASASNTLFYDISAISNRIPPLVTYCYSPPLYAFHRDRSLRNSVHSSLHTLATPSPVLSSAITGYATPVPIHQPSHHTNVGKWNLIMTCDVF